MMLNSVLHTFWRMQESEKAGGAMPQWREPSGAMTKVLMTILQRTQRHPSVSILFGAFVFLYLSLFRFPCTPIFVGEDGNLFLLGAARMLGGQLIYRDFFEHVAPGITVLDFIFFKLFGPHAWVPNVMLVLVGLGLTWVIVVISKRVLSSATVLLPATLFIAFGLGPNLDNTHHWYSALSELCAVALLMKGRTRMRVVAAGALCGLATFFTQTQGAFAVAGLALFLCWEGHHERFVWSATLKRVCGLSASYIGTAFLAFAFFLWKVGASVLLQRLVEFNVKYYSADRTWNSWTVVLLELRDVAHWSSLFDLGRYLFIHALLPFVYLAFWFIYRRGLRGLERGDHLMLLTISGVFSFAAIASSPSTYRMWTVAPLGLILLVWLIARSRRYSRVVSYTVWGCALCAATVFLSLTVARPMQPLDLPRGRLALDPVNYEKLSWLCQQTHPGELVFAPASTEDLFPLALQDPSDVRFFTTNAYTRPEQVSSAVAALEAHQVPMVLSVPSLGFQVSYDSRGNEAESSRGYLRSLFHAIKAWMIGDEESREDNLGPLRDYIRIHYHLVKVLVDQTEVWERNS
jgi:hypothetical protein